MYQAGIDTITLYENNGISFYHFDPLDYHKISNIDFSGLLIEIENNQLPEFDLSLKLIEGNLGRDYNLKFYLLEFSNDNIDIIKRLKYSLYGWKMLVKYYDGTYKFHDTALFCRESMIKPQTEMAFEITLKNFVTSNGEIFDYTPGIDPVAIYRADTTVLTADTEIYTCDYAL